MANYTHYAQTIRADLLLKAFKSLVAKEVRKEQWRSIPGFSIHVLARGHNGKPVLVVETSDPSYVYLQSREQKRNADLAAAIHKTIGGYGALLQDLRNVIDTFLPAHPESVPVRFNAEHIHTMLRTASRAGWKVLESWNGVDCSTFSMSVVKKGTRK